MAENLELDAVRVGDKMRFSVELIKAIAEMPGHLSEVVVVRTIEREPDGCVKVTVERAG